MSKTKHTEGKLFVRENIDGKNHEIGTARQYAVALVNIHGDNSLYNAERIVKCWNMHDDLIDMIKKLKEELEDSQGYNYEGDAYKQIENAEKLIKQSEQ